MIQNPPIDNLVEIVGSKYGLCVVASKRARQLLEQEQAQVVKVAMDKPLTIAAQEIYDGKLIASDD